MRMLSSSGNLSATNVPVMQLIRMAYQVLDLQNRRRARLRANRRSVDVSRVDRFPASAPPPGQAAVAHAVDAATLLRDRFGFVAHTKRASCRFSR
jgi:hypothetical protein